MIDQVNLNNILFLDIETVPIHPDYESVPEKMQLLWAKKAERLNYSGLDPKTPEELYSRAGIYAEFGKVVCISVGIIIDESIRLKSFAGDDEYELLSNFAGLLRDKFRSDDHHLCAHNGKEFDFPYLCRRMIINGIKLPSILNIAGKKPWEIRHYDTMELWKFGDYKSYTSLELLAAVFDIPTPKDDIDGSEVHKVYWQDRDIDRIAKYCQKDVVTIVQLFRRYLGEELIPEEKIVITGEG